MNPKYYGFVEMAFTGLIALGLGFWQLWSLRRDDKRTRQAEKKRPPP